MTRQCRDFVVCTVACTLSFAFDLSDLGDHTSRSRNDIKRKGEKEEKK